MHCYRCNETEKNPHTNWFVNLCLTHKREYLKEKWKDRVKKPIVKPKAVPKKYKHEKYDRFNLSTFHVSMRVYSADHAPYARKWFDVAPAYFHEIYAAQKIANVMYYLRYIKGYTAQDVQRALNMTGAQLNAFICNFPVTKREYMEFNRRNK